MGSIGLYTNPSCSETYGPDRLWNQVRQPAATAK